MPESTLTTERLSLRQLTHQDCSFIQTLVNDPAWLRYIGDRNIHNAAKAQKYIDSSNAIFEQFGFGLWAVEFTQQPSQPLGLCGLLQRPFLAYPDLGFALLPRARGLGVGFEASKCVMQYANTELGHTKLAALTSLDNIASQKLLSSLEFKPMGRLFTESLGASHYFLCDVTR